MRAYLIRRLLLIPVTMLGVTMLVFALTRILPGGPVEQMMLRTMAQEGKRGGRDNSGSASLNEDQKIKIERQFLLDKAYIPAYLAWLGVLPRETDHRDFSFPRIQAPVAPVLNPGATEAQIKQFGEDQKAYEAAKQKFAADELKRAELEDESKGPVLKADATPEEKAKYDNDFKDREAAQGWQRFFIPTLVEKTEQSERKFVLREARVRLSPAGEIQLQESDGTAKNGDAKPNWIKSETWKARFEKQTPPQDGSAPKDWKVVVYKEKFKGVLQWEFGESFLYGDPVMKLITARLPISFFYAIVTLLVTYLVSIPLGIIKAIKHRTFLDSATSVTVFVGYAIPGFALGTVLLYWFAFRFEWFAIRDFTSDNFSALSLWGKVKDLAWHNTLPLACYLVASFALTTMMMKNNLMDNLAADYVRTAVAKGSGFNRAVFRHAVRNSLIPIATTFGQHLTVFVSGSILIETVFDIYGLGLLSFTALDQRDYFVVMALIFLSSLLLMIGNLVSDILVAALNPRIRFD